MSETKHLRYGECPSCGDMCQPEYENPNNPDIEYVICCDCQIAWLLYHDDPTDKRNEDDTAWRKYRIDSIETFAGMGYVPYECKDKSA